ncbi:hypothetical protein [Alloyangia pacifica]|uniref:hypothetical protein n=1 Tax=Alloyangia pacifica TaxID=311180 RepID=UPI00115FA8CB|nr:hypothetical protein [Alloyangia pacifica]
MSQSDRFEAHSEASFATDRRTMLVMALAGCALGACPSTSIASQHAPAASSPALALSQLLPGPSARVIGRKVLESLQSLTSLDDLQQRLSARAQPTPATGNPDLLKQISNLVLEDLRQEKMHYVDGWMLTETEALTCAIIALSEARRDSDTRYS